MTSEAKRKRELGVEARDTRDLRILFAPALIVVVGVGIFPLVFAVIISFQQWEPFFRSHPFNAGANFSEVWNDDVFHTSAINTALFVCVVVPLQTVLGFGLAGGAWWWSARMPHCDSPSAQLKLAEAYRFSEHSTSWLVLPERMLLLGEHPDKTMPETRLCYGVLGLSDGSEVDLDYTLSRDEAGFLEVNFSVRNLD